ncbi:ABC transporter permease [Paenibacillus sp. CAA11]|uniref:ABC transporter permease n=1 Tax=Paenibacillus sp. CAA11 TaxID=1532905 RepID=UPI000D3797EF|nr:ABC transporter permease [Paenibacillus sp. CAA11]AWB43461.1 ABC transporter permease [Paenibacillus sp. CAA11]
MSGFIQIFKMDMKNMVRNPVLVSLNTVFNILLILIMGFLTSGAYAKASDAYNYYAVSLLIYAMLNGAMTATNAFMERDIKKPNLRIIHSPVGKFPIYFSKIAASSLFNYICHLLVLGTVIPLLQLDIGGRNIGFILLLMAPIEFAACAFGIMLCCVFKSEEGASTLVSSALNILAFLGGTFFSWDGMGGAMAWISRLSPVKWLADAFFAIIFDANLSVVWPVLTGSVILSLLFVLGCMKLFKAEDYLC